MKHEDFAARKVGLLLCACGVDAASPFGMRFCVLSPLSLVRSAYRLSNLPALSFRLRSGKISGWSRGARNVTGLYGSIPFSRTIDHRIASKGTEGGDYE